MYSEDFGELQGIHLCADGFKWIIAERSQEGLFHGYLFAPSGNILAHFHHRSHIPIESQLRGILSYYRAGTNFNESQPLNVR